MKRLALHPHPLWRIVRFRCIGILLALSLCWLAVAAQTQTSPAQIPTLFIVGDSTAHVAPDPSLGDKQRVGWGTPFPAYFDPAKIRVVNAAVAGRSSRTFMTEGKWDNVVQQLRPGDFVLINFGHNDPGEIGTGKDRGSLPGIGDDTRDIKKPDDSDETIHTFGWYLRKYVADTRAKGATPILISVTPRNIWTDGKVEMGLGHFREWTAEVARQEHVDYVDLTQIVGRQYQKLGPDQVAAFFPLDHTHTDAAGAELNARSVVAGLKDLPGKPLDAYLSAQGRAVVQASEMSMKMPANPALRALWILGDSTVRAGGARDSNLQSGKTLHGLALIIVHFHGVTRWSPAGLGGQKDRENRAGQWRTRAALDPDAAPVASHNLRANPESQADARISPGPDKRLEERVSDLRANAGSGIADGHANTGPRSIPAFVGIGNADFQRAAAPDRVHGIGYQVQDQVAQFSDHAENRRTFPKISFDRDLSSGQPCPIEIEGGVDDLGDLDSDGFG